MIEYGSFKQHLPCRLYSMRSILRNRKPLSRRSYMRLDQKKSTIKECNSMNDDQLIDYYHETLFRTLGSQVEEMYDRGYEMADIKERISFEKYLREKCDVIMDVLRKRNLDPWE